jgi:hypothetical protein
MIGFFRSSKEAKLITIQKSTSYSLQIAGNGWRLPRWRYKSRKDSFSNQAKRIRNDNIRTDAPLR